MSPSREYSSSASAFQVFINAFRIHTPRPVCRAGTPATSAWSRNTSSVATWHLRFTKSASVYGMTTADYRAVRPGEALSDNGSPIIRAQENARAWIQYIGKNYTMGRKIQCLQFHTIIYRHIILDTHSVADPDITPTYTFCPKEQSCALTRLRSAHDRNAIFSFPLRRLHLSSIKLDGCTKYSFVLHNDSHSSSILLRR